MDLERWYMAGMAQTAKQKALKVTGPLFWIKKASPAAVLVDTKFSAARTWASATFVTYVTSHKFKPSPITKGVSPFVMQA